MKSYTRFLLATIIFLSVAVFSVPLATNAAGSQSGIFSFVAPTAGENITTGKIYDIKWATQDKSARWRPFYDASESVKFVKLTLTCVDSLKGSTNNTIITSFTRNDGEYQWSVPKNLSVSNYCKITITSSNERYSDVSPVFAIVTPVTKGVLAIPTIVASSTTPSQYIASGANGAMNASQATYNFVSNGGASTITELKFSVNGASTVTNICAGVICAQPVNGIADLTGLNITVPSGFAGFNQNIQLSYSPVGVGGVNPGTTSQVALTFVKYNSSGVTATITPNVTAPSITLVGSMPTVSVSATTSSGLILGGQNQIGQVTVTANSQGPIKIKQINFNIGNSGFSSGFGITNVTFYAGSTQITGAPCISNGTSVVACGFTGGYATDYTIPAGQSQIFNLFATVNGNVNVGQVASVSSSATPTGFIWDDTSTNGASGVGLTGSLIYGFPTNSYVIHQ